MADLDPEHIQDVLKKHGLPLSPDLEFFKLPKDALDTLRKWRPSIEMGITDDPEFAQWIDELDVYTLNRIGVGILDLSDWCMRDAFDDGVSIEEAFEMMCEEQDFDPRALIDGDFDLDEF